MQIGIIGLPYSGKTTLFQTLTHTQIDSSSSFKKETNQAIVKVPDKRLDNLTAIFNPKKKVNATIEFVDLIGVQKTDKTSSMFNSQFISKVRTNDAFLHVVRAFDDPTVPHPNLTVDIESDIKMLEDEFFLNDLAFLESRFEKLEKDMMKQKNKDEVKKELDIMKKWHSAIEQNIPLREIEMTDDDLKFIKNYQPLTAKPLMIAVNFDEKEIKNAENIIKTLREKFKGNKIRIEPFFAKIELELSTLSDDEKAIFMEEYGLTESPLEKMIRNAYELLGLQSFFTVGEDECRAWTIRKGYTAQEAAGVIHTDFYNKFIRAEVVSYNDFIKEGSFAKCKEKGLFRLEGKEYIVQDGDIINIRHG